MLKYCRAGPSFGAIVLRPADEPAGRPIILREELELRDDEPVVAVLPGDAPVRAAEEAAVITHVDGIWLPRFKGDRVLVGVDRIAGRLVCEVEPRPRRAGKVATMDLNGATVHLCVKVW